MPTDNNVTGEVWSDRVSRSWLTNLEKDTSRIVITALMVFLILLGLILRLQNLGAASLWHDEAYTWLFTRFDLSELIETVRRDGVNPPFYYLAVKLMRELLGDTEFGLRFLSATAGFLAVIPLIAVGYGIAGIGGATAVAIFWTFHPMAVWYSQEARPYALVAALTSLLIFLFFLQKKSPRNWIWPLVFFTVVLGSLTHYYFFIVIGILILLAVAEIRVDPKFFRKWTLVCMLGFIPLAGWLYWYFSQASPSLGIGWIQQPVWTDVLGTIWNLSSGYGGVPQPGSTLFGLIVLTFIISALIWGRRRATAWKIFLIAIAIPLFAILIFSQKRPIYQDRYFIVLLPFFGILLAYGYGAFAEKVQSRMGYPNFNVVLIPLGIFAVVGLLAGSRIQVEDHYQKEDWRTLSQRVPGQSQSEIRVWLADREAIVPMSYYHDANFEVLDDNRAESCGDRCYWVLRQPYTGTHAFTQAVSNPERPWLPQASEDCHIENRWDSPTGIGLWQVACLRE